MKYFARLAAFLLGLGIGAVAWAESVEDLPPDQRWSAGIGLGAVVGPDYRGSKSYRSYVAPVPYLVYRGPFLRTDEDGVRGEFFRTDRLEFNLSALATVAPDSHKNERRQGMHELASTVELGPALNVNLTQKSLRKGLMLTLPVRAIVTVGRGSPKHIGWLAEPQLMYRFVHRDWRWTLRGGPAFASSDYHDYYYRVSPEEARTDRPAYEANGGYSGINSQLTVSRRYERFWYGFFARYSSVQGASFQGSPLVETQNNVSGGLAVSWIFF